MSEGERLQKYLARSGVASRRACEPIIRAARVRVNGEVVTDPARAVLPADEVWVDGKPVKPPDAVVVIALHKPRGYLTTARDPQDRPTVLDLAPQQFGRLHPVGRLDADSEGLILLTNDGSLTYTLTHPSHGVPKTYRVWAEPSPTDDQLDRLRAGVVLADGPALPEAVEREAGGPWVRVTLREGRNREVRRLFAAVGLEVWRLQRIAIGRIGVGELAPGCWRRLDRGEVSLLEADASQVRDQVDR